MSFFKQTGPLLIMSLLTFIQPGGLQGDPKSFSGVPPHEAAFASARRASGSTRWLSYVRAASKCMSSKSSVVLSRL